MKKLCVIYEEKYVVMASVLDILKIETDKQYAQNINLFQAGVVQKDLVLLVQNHPLIRNFGWLSAKSINKTIEEMKDRSLIFANLLISKEAPLFLTDEGREAYQKQTYHVIASNLMEAREARKLSKWAITIAVFSVIIAICLGVM